VSVSTAHAFSKPIVDAIELIAGVGVRGDAHVGVTVRHRSRVRRDPSAPNLRQVHLVHRELFDDLAAKGFAVTPGDIGENVATEGVDLLGLPIGTRLHSRQDQECEDAPQRDRHYVAERPPPRWDPLWCWDVEIDGIRRSRTAPKPMGCRLRDESRVVGREQERAQAPLPGDDPRRQLASCPGDGAEPEESEQHVEVEPQRKGEQHQREVELHMPDDLEECASRFAAARPRPPRDAMCAASSAASQKSEIVVLRRTARAT